MKTSNYSLNFRILFLIICCNCFIHAKVFAQEIVPTFSNYSGYNISCKGASDGAIIISVDGGEPPYLYTWSNGSFSKNQSGLTAGVYEVTVTDVNNSTFSAQFELKEPNILGIIMHPVVLDGGYNISAVGGDDGRIKAEPTGGATPYSYTWSTGSNEAGIEGLIAGTYTLTVTDMNSCSVTASSTLTEPSELQIVSITSPTHHGFNISCEGVKDGMIDLTVTGGAQDYKYQWSNGSFSEDLQELDPGTYSVIVRDAAGTAVAAQILLTGPQKIEVQLTPTVYSNSKNVSCFGCSNGIITTSIIGGATPFTYSWGDGPTTPGRTGLGVGGYNVQVTDANGCRAEAGLNLIGPDREDWTMLGNSGTTPGTNFIGTTDNKDFVLKTNNNERMRINADGSIKFVNSVTLNELSGYPNSVVYTDATGNLKVGKGQAPNCITPTSNWVTNMCNSGTNTYHLSGNVGIGTITPQARLNIVGGDLKIDNFIGNGSRMVLANAQGILGVSSALPWELGGNIGTNSMNDYLGTGDLQDLVIKTNTIERIRIDKATGNVGIGALPSSVGFMKARSNGMFLFDGFQSSLMLGNDDGDISLRPYGEFGIEYLESTDAGVLTPMLQGFNVWKPFLSTGGVQNFLFFINNRGNVGINVDPNGLDDDDYKLSVNGGIRATKVKVYVGWADYVFKEGYKFSSLPDLEQFISLHGHLPGMPSETEVLQNGVDLGENQVKLLEKIEELTLYIIELEKRISIINTSLGLIK